MFLWFKSRKVTSDKELSIYLFGYPRASRHRLKFARHSSNVVLEEFDLIIYKQSYCFAFDKASFTEPPEGGTR